MPLEGILIDGQHLPQLLLRNVYFPGPVLPDAQANFPCQIFRHRLFYGVTQRYDYKRLLLLRYFQQFSNSRPVYGTNDTGSYTLSVC